MLIDEAIITVKAGNGGKGASSFKRNAQTAKGGPDGGNGGNGGDVYLQGINDITALAEFRYKKNVRAEDGIKGGKQNLYGRNGKNEIIFLPLGTHVVDLQTKESFDIENVIDAVLIVKGGKGGRGNNEFKSATNQTPYYAEKGEPGQERKLFLELKLTADIGLIGLPNAGKSSLLEVLTNARPKIGDYPFTTLEPSLGVFNGIVIADIPGLIEGASKGKGLGDKFLRHIERTKVLVHCIDSSTKNPIDDYQTIRKELEDFSQELLSKKEIILITKIDLTDANSLKTFEKEFKKIKKNIFFISIYDDDSINIFKEMLTST